MFAKDSASCRPEKRAHNSVVTWSAENAKYCHTGLPDDAVGSFRSCTTTESNFSNRRSSQRSTGSRRIALLQRSAENLREPEIAPPARFAIPKLDEPTTPPGLTQSRRQQEAQVIYPENSFVSNSPIKQVSVLSHQQLYHRPSVQQSNPTATSSGAWHSVSPKRKFFFGIDPASCCDEWAGMCGCGGLTANSGHGGPAQGADSCEERCFQRTAGPLPVVKNATVASRIVVRNPATKKETPRNISWHH